jgi:selenocysteine-specific elongation factor
MFVIGTAGHIDHGKSALVKALSGIDPDRLPEEIERGLTIDLGFAWFDLPSGESVGVVDVPGHERFVKNMVAGVGSIDAVMFVIAADDGWMPQSAEHLDILSLLGIKTGIVVLTKTDLVDSDYLALQKEDITSRLKGSFLEGAPIVPFSARDNSGSDDVLSSLQKILNRDVKRFSIGSPRLYIDRSFIIKGIGTVVTGTLIEGEIKPAQELQVCPADRKVRVRGLQTHKKPIEIAQPGSRVAVNLTGAGKDDAPRGSALVLPKHFKPTRSVGVKIKVLSGIKYPLRNASELMFLLGTSVTHSRLRLFGKSQLVAGDEDFAVFRLEKEICCRIGDKFIIRRISPPMTVAGGEVLYWDFSSIKKSKAKQLEILKTREKLDLASVVRSELLNDKNLDVLKLKVNSCFTQEQIDSYLSEAKDIVKAGGILVEKRHLEKYLNPALEVLEECHRLRPWSLGIPVGELSQKLKIPAGDVEEVVSYLLSSGSILQESGLLKLDGHVPHLEPAQQQLAGRLNARLSASPLASPTKKEFIEEDPTYEIVINFLRDKSDIIELKNGVLLTSKDFKNITESVIAHIKKEGRVTASQIKDQLKTTRKYTIPLLEKLDSLGVTRRDGDFRKLGKNL